MEEYKICQACGGMLDKNGECIDYKRAIARSGLIEFYNQVTDEKPSSVMAECLQLYD